MVVLRFILSGMSTSTSPSLGTHKRNKRKRPRSHRNRFKKFHRYALPYHLVLRCRRRQGNRPHRMDGTSFQSPQDGSHRRWRRRNIRSRRRYRKNQAIEAFYSNVTDGRFVQPTWFGDIDEFLTGYWLSDLFTFQHNDSHQSATDDEMAANPWIGPHYESAPGIT